MILNDTVKRLGIYFFYDQDGIVDDYVTYLLDDLIKSMQDMVVVCNGFLNADGRKVFNKYTKDIIVRENKGLDVWAYKTALDYIGWERLQEYDEIILLNATIMGPIYPFAEMFQKMDKRDLDFWGITKYGKEEFDPFGCNPYGYIPEHIQSHFMVYRRTLINSQEFQSYWNNIPEINSYKESVGMHESYFTKYFADKGFKWDVYVNTDDYEGQTTYPLIFYPKELIEQKSCPIFKRRSFFQDYDYVVTNSVGQSTQELYNYLNEFTTYDVHMIWQNVLRTCNQADIARNMHLNYVLSTKVQNTARITKILQTKKIALVMHLYFVDLLEESLKWASAIPEITDVYITTNTDEKKKAIEKVFSRLHCNKLDVRVIENRGRDVSSLLVGVKDVIQQYDYVCFVHDKKTAQLKPGSVGEGFAYKCFKNTLYNQVYVNNIIELFDSNPDLGMLSAPIPNHGDFFPTLGNEWTTNYLNTKKLADKLGVKISIDEKKEPIAPLGTMFWFRPKAMKLLYDYDWKYEDFPPEPNSVDGSLLHAVERVYPFVVQQEGYYPAVVMADEYARIELTNLNYYARTYNRILIENGICNYGFKMREELSEALENTNLNFMISDRDYEKKLQMQLNDIYDSTSWKVTKPIRILGDFIKNISDTKVRKK